MPKKKTKINKNEKSKSEMTMDDLLQKYSDKSPAIGLQRGQKVKGEVVEIGKKRVLIDIGGKSEGVVAEKAYQIAKDYIDTLKVGDTVNAKVLVTETPEGFSVLSLKEASESASWDKIKKAYEDSEVIKVIGKNLISSGMIVDIDGLTGFIPQSQFGKEASKDLDSLVDTPIEVIVIDLDQKNNRVILSEKYVSEEDDIKLYKKALKDVNTGDTFKGEVTNIYDFGAFVKIQVKVGKEKVPLEGLVHISELSWSKVEKVSDQVSVGDSVKVKVIGKNDGRLALSIKQAQDDPWDTIKKKYKKDTKVEGEIVRMSGYGAFVKLEDGVEGLIHLTKIPPGKKLEKGQKVKVYVEDLDEKKRKMSLGLVLTAKPVGYK